jgi:hypothetical protein
MPFDRHRHKKKLLDSRDNIEKMPPLASTQATLSSYCARHSRAAASNGSSQNTAGGSRGCRLGNPTRKHPIFRLILPNFCLIRSNPVTSWQSRFLRLGDALRDRAATPDKGTFVPNSRRYGGAPWRRCCNLQNILGQIWQN